MPAFFCLLKNVAHLLSPVSFDVADAFGECRQKQLYHASAKRRREYDHVAIEKEVLNVRQDRCQVV